MPDPLHVQDLLHGLAGLRLGRPVHLYQQIGSTNDEAKALAEAGAPEGLLVAAETQTAGRGRAGRRWLTPRGTALAFSLVLRPPITASHAARLTMLAGVAACEAIEHVAGVAAVLKWPNDVFIAGQKAGGILLETGLDGDRLDYAVMGLGLNVSAAPGAAAVEFPATSVAAQAGRPVDRLGLLRAILERVEAYYPALGRADGQPLVRAWQVRLTWLGQPVVARTPGGDYHGRAEGADDEGALLLRLESGERMRVLAGDVRLRPAES